MTSLHKIESLKREIHNLKIRYNKKQINHIKINDYTFLIGKENSKFYKPSPTGQLFHREKKSNLKLIMGPFGSGKTTTCLADLIFQAFEMPPWDKGVKKSKFLVVRNTYGELISTTVRTWKNWTDGLGEIYEIKHPFVNIIHKFNCEDKQVQMELVFLALDKIIDFGKLKSLDITSAYLNELSELPEGLIDFVKGRVNRYPPAGIVNYKGVVLADSNPPSERSWIYRDFEKNHLDGYKIFHQPPGVIKNDNDEWIPNPDAENINILGKSYYINQTKNSTQEFIKIYCEGKYGTSLEGKVVYNEYNDDLHSENEIEIDKSLPILIGMDFGLTPAAIIKQITPLGFVNSIAEITSTHIGLEAFLDDLLIPYLNLKFNHLKVDVLIGDPAGITKSQTDEKHCYNILREKGFNCFPAHTNALLPRIDAVKSLLNRLSGGKPIYKISRKGCPILREGFLGHYNYKKRVILNDIIYDDKPSKNFHSHIHDANQYIDMYLVNMLNKPKINEKIINKYNSSIF